MSPLLYLSCAWPGLPALWLRGRWDGLGWASLFSLILNLALLSTFVWTEWLSWAMTATLWIGVASLWSLGAWQSLRQLPALLGTQTHPLADRQFVEAQYAYLQGRYFEAEQVLRRLLHVCPDDVDARLLLASVYRRSQRKRDSLEALKRLSTSPRAPRWAFETIRLRAALDEMSDEPPVVAPDVASPSRAAVEISEPPAPPTESAPPAASLPEPEAEAPQRGESRPPIAGSIRETRPEARSRAA